MPDADLDTDLETPKKKSPLVLILIITNVLVVGGAVAAVLLLGGGGGGGTSEAHAAAEEEQESESVDLGQPGPMIDLPPFVVNLSDEERSHYLKVAVSIEMRDEAAKAAFEPRKTHARHAILMTLGALTLEETRDVDDRERLRERLQDELDKVLGPRAVREVFFTDFVTQ